MKKIVKWTGIVLGGLIGLTLLAGLALYPVGMKKLTRSYPGIGVETVGVPTGPDAIARGRHVAAIWGCTKCHGEDLSGMLLTHDPILGTISASNLTSGKGGIGGPTPTLTGPARYAMASSRTVEPKSSWLITSQP